MWYNYTIECYKAKKNIEICEEIDGSRKQYIEWGNPDLERQI